MVLVPLFLNDPLAHENPSIPLASRCIIILDYPDMYQRAGNGSHFYFHYLPTTNLCSYFGITDLLAHLELCTGVNIAASQQQTHRQTNTQTDKHTHTHRQTYRQIAIHQKGIQTNSHLVDRHRGSLTDKENRYFHRRGGNCAHAGSCIPLV